MGSNPKKGGKRNKNIKTRAIRTIKNGVKRLGSIVNIPRVYSYDMDALHIINLIGLKNIKVMTN